MLPETEPTPDDMTRKKNLTVVTYNIHKGLSQFNKRLVLHDIRDGLKGLDADVAFLQEVAGQGRQERAAPRELARDRRSTSSSPTRAASTASTA